MNAPKLTRETAGQPQSASGSRLVVYAALISNLLVALAKAVAAWLTGSSAMASEAIHSFVDTLNEVLLLYGIRRARQRPDPEHPLGYGRELYFWSFIVALLVFALGAVVSVTQGVSHILHPELIRNPLVNYLVLGLAFLLEGGSWVYSLRQFRIAKGKLGYYEAFHRSKDPPSFMVLFEDSAALLGILTAVIGTALAVQFKQPAWDGAASIVIGVILGATSILLARESKSLLIGERADPRLTKSIVAIAEAEPMITSANGLLTVQLAPDQVVAALSLEFNDGLETSQIEEQVAALENKIRARHPEIVALFVKPQTDKAFQLVHRGLSNDPAERATPN
jgi:cation diffusion facilitator family transporter